MTEETLRYRVEFDQAQVEGKLASLRNALGNSLSTAQYGAQIAAGGYNQLRSDLYNTFGNTFQPPSQQFIRGLEMGALEAGVSFAGVAAPATTLSIGLLGLQPTMAGIATGTSMLAKGAMGAMSTIGAAVPGAASMALGATRMLGAAAFSPPGLAMMAAYGVGKTVVSAGETMIEDFRATDDIRDILTAHGMSQRTAYNMAPNLISAGREMHMGGAELTGVLEAGISSGLISPGGMGDPKRMGAKLIETAKQARNLQNILNTSMSEAMNIMGGMGAAGIQVGDMTSVALNAAAMGSVTGLGQGAMMRAGMMGAQAAGRIGLEASSGAGIAMNAVASAHSGLMALTPGLSGAVGGASGLSNLITQGNLAMFNSPLGQAIGAGTYADPSSMYRFAGGQIGIGQAITMGSQNLLSGGPQNIAKNLFAMDDARSRMSEQDVRMQNISSIYQAGASMGISPNDEARMAMVAGMNAGIDMSTAAGRAQARAMYRGMTDPGVSTRRMAELQGRARALAEQGTGFFATIERNLGWLTPTAIGTRIGTAIREPISDIGASIGERVDRFTTWAGRSVRGIGRELGVPGVRTAEQELYSINIPSAFRDPEIGSVLTSMIEKDQGASMREIVKGSLTKAGIPTSLARESYISEIDSYFANADKVIKSEGPTVSKLWDLIGTTEGLMEDLKGAPDRQAQIAMLMGQAKMSGITGATKSAAAAALVHRDIAADAKSSGAAIGAVAEATREEARTAMQNLVAKGLSAGDQPIGVRRLALAVAKSGSTFVERSDFAARAMAFLGSDTSQSMMFAQGMDKDLVSRLEVIKRDGHAVEAVKALQPVVSKAALAAEQSAVAQNGIRAMGDNLSATLSGMGDVANVGGMQVGAEKTFMDSSRAVDRELLDSIRQINRTLVAERMLLQSLVQQNAGGPKTTNIPRKE